MNIATRGGKLYLRVVNFISSIFRIRLALMNENAATISSKEEVLNMCGGKFYV